MNRTVSPELLDSLPAQSAAARHSRRDLRWFNRLLGNNRWWRSVLPQFDRDLPGLEIGAGDGALAQEYHLDGLDLQAAPATWASNRTWHQSDVLRFDRWQQYPLVVSNLFLHHLNADQLATLGARWDESSRVILACEPWRARGFRSGFALVCWLVRAHAVSRHDGRVSVEAGFRDNELPQLLKLSPDRWQWAISHSVFGMYRMIARRRQPS